MADQPMLCPTKFDVSSTSFNQASLLFFIRKIILYAEWTEKRPRGSTDQAQKSSTFLVQSGIVNIASASSGKNTCLTRSSRQEAVVASINSDTRRGGFAIRGLMGLVRPVRGIQLCSHIHVDLPSPIRLMIPCLRIFLQSIIARQI